MSNYKRNQIIKEIIKRLIDNRFLCEN